MAVDYFHRLAVIGASDELRSFRRSVGRTVSRKPVPRLRGWRERVPLSFAAMYARCPELTRVAQEPPFDPYELSAWLTVRLADGRGKARYQFQTRNLEMLEYLVPFSRSFPGLDFVLVTMCFNDDSIISYLIRNGRSRAYTIPEKRREWHWEQVRKHFHIAGDDVYYDDEARHFAEDGILNDAMNYWETRAAPNQTKKADAGRKTCSKPASSVLPQTQHWRDQAKVRDLRL